MSQHNQQQAVRDFRRLWLGQSLSLFGDQFLLLVLPLLAVELLGASESQAVLLRLAMFIPFLIFGLPAGAMVDRLAKRQIMIVCNVIQLLIFTAIFVLTTQGLMTFPLLMLMIFIVGIAIVFFQVAYASYLPELFSSTAELQKGNAKLFLSESVAKTLGPMIGGPIMALLGIVTAVAFNALALLGSVLALLSIKPRQSNAITEPKAKGWMLKDIIVGLRFVMQNPKLEPVFSCGFVYVLFLSVIDVSLVLYCREILNISVANIGLVVGSAAAGFPLGNILSTKLVKHWGISRTLVLGASISVCGLFLTALMGSLGAMSGLILAGIVHGIGQGSFGPTSMTLRQIETPQGMLGRVNAVQRFFIWGAIPLGSAMASLIVHFYGLGNTLWIGGIGTILCLIPLLRRGILLDLKSQKSTEI